jgi:hypothetical protein
MNGPPLGIKCKARTLPGSVGVVKRSRATKCGNTVLVGLSAWSGRTRVGLAGHAQIAEDDSDISGEPADSGCDAV